MNKICSRDGCKRKAVTVGLCRRHYDAQPERKLARAEANRKRLALIKLMDPEKYAGLQEVNRLSSRRWYDRNIKGQKVNKKVPNGQTGPRKRAVNVQT